MSVADREPMNTPTEVVADQELLVTTPAKVADDQNDSSDEHETSGAESLSEATTCRYSSKPCTNPRALKKTGDMHSFCEFHRSMANRNQRRCEHKRRTKRQIEKAIRKRVLQPQPIQMFMDMDMFQQQPAHSQSLSEPTTKRRRASSAATVVVDAPLIDLCGTRFQSKTELAVVVAAHQGLPLEPYHHPVPLHVEDLEYLLMTVVDSSSYSCVV